MGLRPEGVKFTLTVKCPHFSDRRHWIMGGTADDVAVIMHGCDPCAAFAERAGIDIQLVDPDEKRT